MKTRYYFLAALLILSGWINQATAQDPFRRLQGMGRGLGSGGGKVDSVIHRTGLEDSITIRFRYLDSSRLRSFDTSLVDFYDKIPSPWHSVHLGNLGTAARSLIYTPLMKSGFDHGFHAFDNYLWNVAETKFYTTTRPFSEANYMLGSGAEQFIQLTHTQNIKPNWNAGIVYRLINSPGIYQNQNTNHNNYRFHSWYQSRNKRYQNFFVIVGNKLQAGESGGIRTDQDYLDNPDYKNRSVIPTQLGLDQAGRRNFFSTSIPTGSFFTTAHYYMRQQYDLGQKDSIVTDSSVIPLFYPRLRLEHTISYNTYKYRFRDDNADSTYYKDNYNTPFATPKDSFFIQDHWRVLTNDFSIYQFPDAKNPQQFIKVGAALENLSGRFDTSKAMLRLGNTTQHNFLVHGEYRNKTRNQKWDIEAFGNFYVNGMHAGNYTAFLSLKREISKKLGYLELGFQNTNRTPSFVFDPGSAFWFTETKNFNKENITNIFGSIEMPLYHLKLSANYYLISNLAYYRDGFVPDQYSDPFNVLQITAQKKFKVAKSWNWRTWIVMQQRAGNGPVNMPLLTTRNMFSYDGNLGFKNLNASMGLEFRYFTPYKAAGYSPVIGQYAFQDTTNIKLKMPDISAFVHFRIRTFTAYVRAENLNSFNLGGQGGGFTKNNMPTLNYPYPGLQIRVGIFWGFVN